MSCGEVNKCGALHPPNALLHSMNFHAGISKFVAVALRFASAGLRSGGELVSFERIETPGRCRRGVVPHLCTIGLTSLRGFSFVVVAFFLLAW
ncbi:hypothetical protein C4D60_Mb03t19230 [Musa balbisiana]|uniref:Uncharacterized protein n=1 Tax=Musa balbisiana TaxID=52838 RepID=A0A4S8JC30_MUSBA|nr:hypothetical protein C4D60_Mb03t19230 [Musa balbisiana]